jgi:hypothetical protein
MYKVGDEGIGGYMSRNVPKKRWLGPEIEAVKQGIVPEGRTYLQAASYAHKHGIPWKELRKNTCNWWWTPAEDNILLAGKIVPNRSWESIRQHKEKLGIPREAKPRFSDFRAFNEKRKNNKINIIPRNKPNVQ